jgi:lipoprotein-releasing system ATP-binding protein
MSETILIAENINKYYKKDIFTIEVLKEFSLNIKAGEFIAVVGPSGSGKSTLLHILGGLDKPDSGIILYKGVNISSNNGYLDKYRNKSVGFVFQYHYLMQDFTALENIMLPALIKGDTFKNASRKGEDILGILGLSDRMQHYPSELSGGEQQRATIGRALINSPEVLLADEPTGNLDRANSDKILSIFKKLNADGLTIIVVTHDEHIASNAHRVIHLEKR